AWARLPTGLSAAERRPPWTISQRGPDHPMVGVGSDAVAGLDQPLEQPADDQVGHRAQAVAEQRLLDLLVLTGELADRVVEVEVAEVDAVGEAEDEVNQAVVAVGLQRDQ